MLPSVYSLSQKESGSAKTDALSDLLLAKWKLGGGCSWMVEQTTGETVLSNLRHPMRRQRPLLHHRGFIFKAACFSTNQKMEVEKGIKLGTFGIIYGSSLVDSSQTNHAMKRKELS